MQSPMSEKTDNAKLQHSRTHATLYISITASLTILTHTHSHSHSFCRRIRLMIAGRESVSIGEEEGRESLISNSGTLARYKLRLQRFIKTDYKLYTSTYTELHPTFFRTSGRFRRPDYLYIRSKRSGLIFTYRTVLITCYNLGGWFRREQRTKGATSVAQSEAPYSRVDHPTRNKKWI